MLLRRNAPTTCTVPDVVGAVHQYAHDAMQAAGRVVECTTVITVPARKIGE